MKILVFGDSHALYFGMTEQVKRYLKHNIEGIQINNHVYAGGTINGFGRRDSTLGLYDKVLYSIDEFKPDVVCIGFGQVDLELGYYYKKYVKEEDFEFNEWALSTLTVYSNFIKGLGVPVVVKGLNPPVLVSSRNKAINYTRRIITENIKDKSKAKLVINRMKAEFPSDLYRISMTNIFNNHLKTMCSANNWNYFDLHDELTDLNTGMIRSAFIPTKPDHHVIDSIYVRSIFIDKLLDEIKSQLG
ncbi:hypothetical protein [Cobetia amphilecti]|uniref:hypothetical protein n=1 Tax=Cobetia amphilecti TaxID=1055104 RepID=UPI002448052C|nr:hypothetical protein [Cobetia litoralis]MDH2421833.1 hypothetical protein [Cobetia litoralis]